MILYSRDIAITTALLICATATLGVFHSLSRGYSEVYTLLFFIMAVCSFLQFVAIVGGVQKEKNATQGEAVSE